MHLNLRKVINKSLYENIYYIFAIIFVLCSVPYIYTYYAMPISIYISQNIHLCSQLNGRFAGLVLLYIVMQTCHLTSLTILGIIIPKINRNILKCFTDNIYSIENSNFHINPGKITQCLFDLIENFNAVLINFVQFVFDPIITILLNINKIYRSDIKYITLISISWIILIVSVFIVITRYIAKYNKESYEYQQKISGYFGDVLSNLFVSQVFQARPLEKIIQKDTVTQNTLSFYLYSSLGFLKSSIAMLNILIFLSLIYIMINFAKTDTMNYRILESMFQGIMISIWRLTGAATDISKKVTVMDQAIDYLYQLNLQPKQQPLKSFIPKKKIIEHTINIENLNFSFCNNVLFKNAHLEIKPNDKIVLKGCSGCGKSTLLSFLCGLNKTKEISLDRVSIYDLDRKWLQNNITYIAQGHMLYNTSILENITLGKEYDKNKLEDVLKLCNLNEVIVNFPNGINENVGINGNKLSGGQKQRISVARALLFDKPSNLLICDELFNHLDQKNISDIKNLIETIAANRTTIIVNHNNYFDDFGRIIYIENKTFLEKK